jgi:ATP-dependent Zn protease
MKLFLLYIDPGSGSYLVQVIIAAVLGVAFYFKTIWWKIKSFFGAGKKEDNINNQEEHD